MLAFITGSGLYDHPSLEPFRVCTRFGEVELLRGTLRGRGVLVLPRHGAGHRHLPHQINHRAHLTALREAGARAVVSCSVCGLLRPDWEAGRLILAEDLHFPDNRLGNGEACTLFDTPGEAGRGHLLAGSHFHRGLTDALAAAAADESVPYRGVYAHVAGPRFNTVAEIRALRAVRCDFLSQTCGPEAVLANELELPYALAAVGVDHANGVCEIPTPVETLNENLGRARGIFLKLMETLAVPEEGFRFENFVYRFP